MYIFKHIIAHILSMSFCVYVYVYGLYRCVYVCVCECVVTVRLLLLNTFVFMKYENKEGFIKYLSLSVIGILF